MPSRLRKPVLTAHIVASVGWPGAVVAFLAPVIVALNSQDAQIVRGALLTLEPIGWYVLIPLAGMSVLTGIIQGLGTAWGLIRHYWVVLKLVIGLAATTILVGFVTQTLSRAAERAAAGPTFPLETLRGATSTARDHALIGLAGLLLATVLAVYKPRAMTGYGQRKRRERRERADRNDQPAEVTAVAMAASDRGDGRRRWVRAAGFIAGVLIWAFLFPNILGVFGMGSQSHGPGPQAPESTQPDDSGGRPQPPTVPEQDGGHQPPPGIPDHGG